jgi:hypothetical protein
MRYVTYESEPQPGQSQRLLLQRWFYVTVD